MRHDMEQCYQTRIRQLAEENERLRQLCQRQQKRIVELIKRQIMYDRQQTA